MNQKQWELFNEEQWSPSYNSVSTCTSWQKHKIHLYSFLLYPQYIITQQWGGLWCTVYDSFQLATEGGRRKKKTVQQVKQQCFRGSKLPPSLFRQVEPKHWTYNYSLRGWKQKNKHSSKLLLLSFFLWKKLRSLKSWYLNADCWGSCLAAAGMSHQTAAFTLSRTFTVSKNISKACQYKNMSIHHTGQSYTH